MNPLRTRALAALREGRVAVVLAGRAVLAPRIEPAQRVTAFVTSSRSDNPAEPTGYFVDLAGGLWTCTCRSLDTCPHVAAVQLATGHPSDAAKEKAAPVRCSEGEGGMTTTPPNRTSVTDDPRDPRLGRGVDSEPIPQHEVYLVLSDEERAKGFIRPLRRAYIHTDGCGATTTMGIALCETYARQPSFYGATYCTGCHMHRPVGEFRWAVDGQVVGS